MQIPNQAAICDKCKIELTLVDTPIPSFDSEQLRPTYTPSDDDITRIRTAIEQTELEIDQCDAEINKLRGMCVKLQSRKEKLEDYRDRNRAVLSPIRTLPFEILAQIFLMGFDVGLRVHTDIYAPALTLSHVCSFWRNVAINTTKLWSSLSIDLCYPRSKMVALVGLYLLWSKSAPLDLKVTVSDQTSHHYNGYNGWPNQDSDTWGDWGDGWGIGPHYRRDARRPRDQLGPHGLTILQYLIDNGERWASASFDLDTSVLSSAVPDEVWPNSHYPINLHFLDMAWPHWQRSPLPKAFLACAQSLRSLRIPNGCRDTISTFKRLRELAITTTLSSAADLAWLFSNCPELLSLELQVDSFTEFPASLPPFPQLESLSLTYEETNFPRSNLLSALTLPSLTTLEFQNSSRRRWSSFLGNSELDMADWQRDLTNMLRRSACQLQVLRCHDPFFASDNDLLEVLALTPTLTQISLNLNRTPGVLTSNFFQRLSVDTHNLADNMLPKLQSFTLIMTGIPPESSLPDPEFIASVIESRRSQSVFSDMINYFNLHAGLSSSRAHTSGRNWVKTFSTNIEPRLRALEKEGLGLTLLVYCDDHSEDTESSDEDGSIL
ncbi:hypothetical protein D9758_012171 [Tetrapyrgos nigripes]|uniref:F-box/LRR-repeat protein 15/At3g58940/PEG3-like LRR domain-containing protein n=1 Tax=Tetrapyrgos nigripes TaxID=182062 RepID=A0A8H5CHH4_9AGAR|nr:hypothetical protein D9758_012171 [Tetrapyrgos nigripes]